MSHPNRPLWRPPSNYASPIGYTATASGFLDRAELLAHIQETGSISKTAKAMEMSYKKAWQMVEEMNAHGKSPYVIACKGGKEGGGTELTERGKALVAAYNRLDHRLHALLKEEQALLGLI